jgi:hypothetical protein
VHLAVGHMVSGISPLVTRGSSRTGIAVQASPADCAYSMARRVCVNIDSISADGTRRVAVPVLVRVYAFVADCTPRPAVAVAVSAGVLTTDPASRIAISISIGVYGAAAVNAGRIARSIRVKDGDRRMYTSRTRFIPAAVLDRFDSRAWPEAPATTLVRNQATDPVEITARLRRMWP